MELLVLFVAIASHIIWNYFKLAHRSSYCCPSSSNRNLVNESSCLLCERRQCWFWMHLQFHTFLFETWQFQLIRANPDFRYTHSVKGRLSAIPRQTQKASCSCHECHQHHDCCCFSGTPEAFMDRELNLDILREMSHPPRQRGWGRKESLFCYRLWPHLL